MALTMDDVDTILVDAEPELLQRLNLDIDLKAKLVKEDVITDDLLDELAVPLRSKKELVHMFLADLRYGPVERFLNFCKVVYEDGRPQILKALNVDITDVWNQLGSTQPNPTPSPTHDGCAPQGTKGNLFMYQSRYYQEVLSKVPIYEYVMRSSFCQIEEIFTRLELIDNQNDQDRQTFPFRVQSKSIQLDEMFDDINNSFLRILLEGKPGSGKTSILKHCAIEWAKDKLNGRREQGAASSGQGINGGLLPLLNKDLVIFIDKTHEKTDLASTIKAALKGPKEEQDKAFQYWQTHPHHCLLMCDGIDELIHEELVNEIFHVASQASCNMLISCRMGHRRLEKQVKNFNRHVKVSGFDPKNAQVFVQKFLKTLNSGGLNANEEKLSEEKTRTLCSFLISDSVQSFYSNPLNCAFLCLLYNSGAVKEEELSSLKLVDLFRKQQEQLLKRECVKRGKTQKEASELERLAQPSVEGIHRMALHSLVHNEKHVSYSVNDLEKFDIDITSPAMTLLHAKEQPQGKVYTWPHQVIKEFHASSAVRNETIMYMIASRPELNQLTKFLLSYLVDTDIEAARNLLLAMMLMQTSDPPCSKPKWYNKQSHLEHPCTQISNLRTFLLQQNIDELLKQPLVKSTMAEKHLRVKEIQQCLSHTDWAVRNTLGLVQLVDMTLEVSTKEEHYQMLQSVMHPFLPSAFSGSLRSYSKVCPWDAGDDDEVPEFVLQMCMVGGSGGCELHPVRRRFPFLLLKYYEMGGIAYLAGKNVNLDHPTSCIHILVSSPADFIDTAENTDILNLFAKRKRGKVDVVDISVYHPGLNWNFLHPEYDKGDSSDWKKAILLVHDIFRPKFCVSTTPSHLQLLTEEDQWELRDILSPP